MPDIGLKTLSPAFPPAPVEPLHRVIIRLWPVITQLLAIPLLIIFLSIWCLWGLGSFLTEGIWHAARSPVVKTVVLDN